MLLDEKVMVFRGLSCRIGLWHCARVKRMNMDIIFDISGQKKNTRIFNSKICQRREHFQCRKIADSARAVIPLVSIGFPIVSQSSKKLCFATLNELASLTNFRVQNSCIFFCPEMSKIMSMLGMFTVRNARDQFYMKNL